MAWKRIGTLVDRIVLDQLDHRIEKKGGHPGPGKGKPEVADGAAGGVRAPIRICKKNGE